MTAGQNAGDRPEPHAGNRRQRSIESHPDDKKTVYHTRDPADADHVPWGTEAICWDDSGARMVPSSVSDQPRIIARKMTSQD